MLLKKWISKAKPDPSVKDIPATEDEPINDDWDHEAHEEQLTMIDTKAHTQSDHPTESSPSKSQQTSQSNRPSQSFTAPIPTMKSRPPIGNWQSKLAAAFTSNGTVSNYRTHIERLLGKGYCDLMPEEVTEEIVHTCWN